VAVDVWVWENVVRIVAYLVLGLSWLNRVLDVYVIDVGFDAGCRGLRRQGRRLAALHQGRVQVYLRVLGLAIGLLLLWLTWGWRE